MPSVGPSSSWRRQRTSQTRNRPLRVSSTTGAPAVAEMYCPAEAPSAGWVMYSSPAVLMSAAKRAAMPAPHRKPKIRLIRGSGSRRSMNRTAATSSGTGARASGSAMKNGVVLCPDATLSPSSMPNTMITHSAASTIPMMTPTGARPGGLPSMTALGSKTGTGVPMAASLPGTARARPSWPAGHGQRGHSPVRCRWARPAAEPARERRMSARSKHRHGGPPGPLALGLARPAG